MAELDTIAVANLEAEKVKSDPTDKRQHYCLDFVADMSDEEALDKTREYKFVCEAVYEDGTTHPCCTYVWQGGLVHTRDNELKGQPIKPAFSISHNIENAKRRPTHFQVKTDAKQHDDKSTIAAKLIEAKDMMDIISVGPSADLLRAINEANK